MNIGALMALVIVAISFAIAIKSISPVMSNMISIALCIVIIALCIMRIGVVLDTMRQLTEYVRIDRAYIIILIKLIGIAYICEFAAGISKDAGYSAVASEIELLGKLTMLMVSLPVLLSVLSTIAQIM